MRQFSYLLIFSFIFLMGCQTLPKSSEYQDLFNGVDLTGWRATFGEDSFSVIDGILKVNSTGRGPHLLYVGKSGHKRFKDFELVVVSRANPGSNSGVYFHTDGTFIHKQGWLHTGYEAQLNCTKKEKKKTGSLYGIQNVYESPVNELDWFEMKIRVKGQHIQIWVDGTKTADYHEPENPERRKSMIGRKLSPRGGFIALQAHDPNSTWFFKSIKIKEL
jgi:hypothetical protein